MLPPTLRALACAFTLIAVLLAPQAQAKPKPVGPDAICANRLCTKNKPHRASCWRYDKRRNVSKCFIRRAARHFHQPRSLALAIAHRESRFDFKVTNSSSGAAGLYQFMPTLWQQTPYRNKSRYHPRWASLAAMWAWRHGWYSHWSL